MPESIHSRAAQTKILLNMLPQVAFEGWTINALEAAVIESGYIQADSYRAFDGEPRQAIEFFFDWINDTMAQQLAQLDISHLKISARIENAILIRLQILAPYKETMRRTMQWLANPLHAPLAIKYLYQAVDSIWYAVGDTSVDFSFYTKRASLAGIYSTTIIKWLTDSSSDQAATEQFLKNRISNVMQFHHFKHKIKSFSTFGFKSKHE